GLLVHQALAVLPGLARERRVALATADQLEQALGESAAPAPHGAPLGRQVPGETREVEHRVVPDRPRPGCAAAAAKRDEMHGRSLLAARGGGAAARRQGLARPA